MVREIGHEYINNNNSDKYHPILGKNSIEIQTRYKCYKSKDFKKVQAKRNNIQGLSGLLQHNQKSETQADIPTFQMWLSYQTITRCFIYISSKINSEVNKNQK